MELLECKDVRIVPNIQTQKDVANYILTLHDGYIDCFLKLRAIREMKNEK